MGLIIRPKSKIRALQCHIFSWESLKVVYRGEPISIAWESISQVLVENSSNKTQYTIFYSANEFETCLVFFSDEVEDTQTFEAFLSENPQKILHGRFAYIRKNFLTNLKYKYKYAPVTEAYILGFMAFTFMFFQFRYFGSLLIQKYQFLIKASCNQQCAETLWSISAAWVFTLIMIVAPLIPILFYKKIYKYTKRSKNIQTINTALMETMSLAMIGIFILASVAPSMLKTTTKYSNLLTSYSNGTIQAKLSQKVEMASKRAFQGDIDDVEEVEILEDQHEE